jgi:DNA-binding SARP family transcriptional activator
LSRLRTALAGADEVHITQRSGGYQLAADPETVDLHRFQRLLAGAKAARNDRQAAALLTEALALWSGPALVGLDSLWAGELRDRLAGQRLGAQLDLIDVHLRGGDHAESIGELDELAAAHPLDERVAGQLMLVRYRTGRQAEALREYERIRGLLADELGAGPSPVLQRLHQRILRGDPSLSAKAAQNRAAARPVPRQLPAPPRSFVGRADVLAALDAEPNAGSTVTISGVGGVGKTWLALRWAASNIGAFPDGQLYVNLGGFDPSGEPMPVAVAVRGYLLGQDSLRPRRRHGQPDTVRGPAAPGRGRRAAAQRLGGDVPGPGRGRRRRAERAARAGLKVNCEMAQNCWVADIPGCEVHLRPSRDLGSTWSHAANGDGPR